MQLKDQNGILGEAAAIKHFIQNGYEIFTQFSGKAPFDFVAYLDNELYRVSVKSTTVRSPSGRWVVQIRRKRHNRTGNMSFAFDNTSCDLVAVYIVPEDRVIIIDSTMIKTGTVLLI